MDVTTAVLCDFAQVRERLLFVSSGAVTRVYRGELPTQLGVMLGLVVDVPHFDAGRRHELVLRVVNRHNAELASVRSTIEVGDQGLFPNEVQQVPMALSLARVPVHSWGTHQVRVYVDDRLARSLTLYVVPAGGVVTSPAPEEPAPESQPLATVAASASPVGAMVPETDVVPDVVPEIEVDASSAAAADHGAEAEAGLLSLDTPPTAAGSHPAAESEDESTESGALDASDDAARLEAQVLVGETPASSGPGGETDSLDATEPQSGPQPEPDSPDDGLEVVGAVGESDGASDPPSPASDPR